MILFAFHTFKLIALQIYNYARNSDSIQKKKFYKVNKKVIKNLVSSM